MSNNDKWYFAYGSNLSIDRKESRTGSIRQADVAAFEGYRLVFNKRATSAGETVYANITESPNDSVWGVAYLCDAEAFEQLDRYEGVDAGHYERIQVTVKTKARPSLIAEVYVAHADYVVDPQTPSDEYLSHIVSGAHKHGLREDYIDSIQMIANRGKTLHVLKGGQASKEGLAENAVKMFESIIGRKATEAELDEFLASLEKPDE